MSAARGTKPLADGLADWRVRAQQHVKGQDLSGVVIPVGETTEDKAERLARQDAGRRTAWARRLPKRYVEARLAALKPQQDPDGKVTGWLDSEHLTLLLVGEAGRGKTYAAYALGHEAVERGLWTVAWTMADLNAALRPGGDEDAYDEVTSCDLLLLDDLGREKMTEWTLEVLQRLVDHRNRERKRTIITSNTSFDTMVERYGSPIVQRLLDDTVIAKIAGDKMRIPAAW